MRKYDFGGNIVAMLKKRNMTQRELAHRIGATEATISRYVNNSRKPNVATAYKIAQALDCDINELILGKEV